MVSEQTINDVLGYIARSCRTKHKLEDFQQHRILREYALEHGASNEDEAEAVIAKAVSRYKLISNNKDELQKHYKQLLDVKKNYGCGCDEKEVEGPCITTING